MVSRSGITYQVSNLIGSGATDILSAKLWRIYIWTTIMLWMDTGIMWFCTHTYYLFPLFFFRFGTFWMGNEPTIFLKDLDLIKKVEVTDHEHFFDYGIYPTPTSLIFSYPHHIYYLNRIFASWWQCKESIWPCRLKGWNMEKNEKGSNSLFQWSSSEEECCYNEWFCY